jgi:drug/metabolite transporter (DMT)-like permease
MKSLSIEEVSRVMSLFSFTPLFVLLLSTIFLSEIFRFEKYVGIFLIVFGSIFVSVKKYVKVKLSRALIFMLLASVLGAFHCTIQRLF